MAADRLKSHLAKGQRVRGDIHIRMKQAVFVETRM
jgi:hypothetical protein